MSELAFVADFAVFKLDEVADSARRTDYVAGAKGGKRTD